MTYTNEEKMNITNRMNQGDLIKELCTEYGPLAAHYTDG